MSRTTMLRLGAVALLITAVMFAAAPRSVQAQSGPTTPPNTVTVTGIGTATGTPDAANIHLGVEIVNENAADAFNEANSVIERVTRALIEAGVKPQDITTVSVNIYSQSIPPMDPAASTTSLTRTYTASILLRVQVLDEGTDGQAMMVGAVINAAVEAGANMINGIEIGLNDTKSLEGQARIAAVEDARARAEALAAAVGATVGAVVSMEEYSNMSGPIYYAGRGGGGGSDVSASISQGQFTVGVQVRVTYVLTAAAN